VSTRVFFEILIVIVLIERDTNKKLMSTIEATLKNKVVECSCFESFDIFV
jgi:hypothetical protein